LDPAGGFRGVVAGAKALAGGEKTLIILDSVYPLVSAGTSHTDGNTWFRVLWFEDGAMSSGRVFLRNTI
jgi:hypothetical protein